jgi:hypothetical protein
MLVEDARNNIGDVVELHDLAINNGIRLKVFEPQVDELETAALPLKLNRLDRARTDIKANEILLTHTFFEHDLFVPRDEKRPNSVLLT